MELIYNVQDKPKFKELIVFAFQQLLAIMAATIAVPAIIGNGMTASAALFGAGAGTIAYLLITRFKSPVFLGSSFAFIGSMFAAFAGATSMQMGFLGLIIGAVSAGLVYVIISLVVTKVGVEWINTVMPAAVIGPTVAIIGLSLAGNAIGDLTTADAGGSAYAALVCGLVTLFTVIACSIYGKKMAKLIPFVIGIGAGYIVSLIFTVCGVKIIDFTPFHNLLTNGKVTFGTFFNIPQFTFIEGFKGFKEINGAYLGTIIVAYVPVAFVVFAEHIADHKNLSSIIGTDLLKDPGLNRTLLG
ncbi:MAG: hypothetical protein IKX15_01885, partial [Spirochaetales bacterium]|nr:hypothetical protein [Spirochaetales bacterium]